jgi:hypothetical protein
MIIHRNEFHLKNPPATRGLGDVAHVIFQPIARGIDAIAGTNVQGCGGCKQRRESWNQAIPDVLHPFRKPGEDQTSNPNAL